MSRTVTNTTSLQRGHEMLHRNVRLKRTKFDYEMVHSEVYLNKYVVSIAPFSTPACPDCCQNITFKHGKLLFFACFRFLISHAVFQGVSWPHLPLCADAHDAPLLYRDCCCRHSISTSWQNRLQLPVESPDRFQTWSTNTQQKLIIWRK